MFINHPQFRKMAEGFAQRIAGENEPVVKAYQLAYGRQPSRDEIALGESFIRAQHQPDGDQQKALADFCGALMSANEFIYVE
ncbi:MAG: hypothetical protein ACI9UA_003839 [Pseudoalteromonas tetraodonis]